ncbi:MAG: hypothetical protein JXM69_07585 [Anaerolineae bacterium]|nr:hypothetical protein [Anaerolineae bacterium]
MERVQLRNSNNNHRRNNHRAYPELVVTHSVSESDAAYYAALKLVARIDEDLTRGVRHYRNKAGILLTTLDQVVHAILTDDLSVPEVREEAEVMWLPQELAA